jgi:glycosyltransferase involved in cell wall biosynthesis
MHTRLNVLVLAQYFPPDMGGASARASIVVKGLLYKGCEVTVVAAFPHYPHGDIPKKYKGKPIVSERFHGAKLLRVWVPSLPHSSIVNRIILHTCFMVSALFALPFVGKVDVIWAANPNLFSVFPAIVYGFIERRAIVRNVDDLWPEVFYELGIVRSKLMRKILDFLALFSYTVPAAITPISAGYKRWIIEKYKIYAEKVHVIEVGVEKVKPTSSVNQKKCFVVMYSGVLGLGYDFNIVLEAAKLLEKNSSIVFIIRGVGELVSELKKRINELRLNNVILDTRFLPKDYLSALLASADVFVLPMSSMKFVDLGLPAKVFEYQAYGKPIICVSNGESAKYIETTKSGLVVKDRDARSFAEAVVKLHEQKELAAELGFNGLRFVSEKLTVEKIGERMHRILASVAHRG